jgi:hypothetical protein
MQWFGGTGYRDPCDELIEIGIGPIAEGVSGRPVLIPRECERRNHVRARPIRKLDLWDHAWFVRRRWQVRTSLEHAIELFTDAGAMDDDYLGTDFAHDGAK